MLTHISSAWGYREFLDFHKQDLDPSQLQFLHSKYRSALHKLDPSLASDILFPLYSSTGRPAINPAFLFVLLTS